MSKPNQVIGKWGEELAAKYLEQKGYSIVARNVRTQYGEIDLILTQPVVERSCAKDVLVFVEVKTRRTLNYGYPEESINTQKKTHLLQAIQSYLQDHPELENEWRVDVVAIHRSAKDQKPLITHFINAIFNEPSEFSQS
jgi:putative endonuclease